MLEQLLVFNFCSGRQKVMLLYFIKHSRQIGAVEALLPSVNKHKNH